MARVAVINDRPPDDASWKGGVAWTMVNALAESQHDIQVFTPLDPAELPSLHPRVNVARPGPSFGINHLLAWSRALVQFRPDVVHTVAPREDARFSNLTCWPYLEALGPVLPHARRVATLFDSSDVGRAASKWLMRQSQWTVFHREVGERAGYSGNVDVLDVADFTPARGRHEDDGTTLIPAPVSEWTDLEGSIDDLRTRLNADPDVRVRIVGGWGDVDLGARRRAWSALGTLAGRVEMGPARSLEQFVADASRARAIWSEPLGRDSWRARLARAIADGARGSGESVNLLSRIYSAPGRW